MVYIPLPSPFLPPLRAQFALHIHPVNYFVSGYSQRAVNSCRADYTDRFIALVSQSNVRNASIASTLVYIRISIPPSATLRPKFASRNGESGVVQNPEVHRLRAKSDLREERKMYMSTHGELPIPKPSRYLLLATRVINFPGGKITNVTRR